MSIPKRRLLIVALVSWVHVCVAAPTAAPRLAYSPAPGEEIRTIAVIAPPDPTVFEIRNFDDIKYGFGGVGGMIRGKAEQATVQQVSAALSASGEKFRAGLALRIAQRLGAAGYSAVVEPGAWVDSDGRLSLQLDKVESTADAVILVMPTTIGFINPGGPLGGEFLPTVTARVEMVGADRSRVIYRGFHSAGWIPRALDKLTMRPVEGWTTTAATTTYPNIRAVQKDIPGAIQQLYSAEDAVAIGVARELQKK
jgi:hypothetical protein